MPASNYLRAKIIDHVFRNTPFTAPTTVYVSLHTGDPTAGNEVTGTWYARQAVTFSSQSVAGQSSNANTITFNAVTDTGFTASHFGLHDGPSAGANLLEHNALAANKTFSISDVPSWLPGQLALLAT